MNISKSLKGRMLLRLLIVLFCVVVIIGTTGIMFAYKISDDTLEQTISETALVGQGQVKNRIYTTEAIIEELGLNYQLASDSVDSEHKMEILDYRADLYGFIECGITGTDGRNLKGSSLAAFDWCLSALAGETAVSSPSVRADGSYAMYVAAPLRDIEQNGKIVGIVYAAVDASFLSEITNRISIGETGTTYIIDNTGTVIAHVDYSKVTERENAITAAQTDSSYKALAALEQAALDSEVGQAVYGTYTEDGVVKCAAFSVIEGTDGWVIGITTDQSEFTGEIIICIIVMLVIAAVCLVIAALFILHHTNNIVVPVQNVKAGVEMLSDGNLNVSVRRTTNDEVGQLADTLNSTAANLKEYIGEISRISQQLADGNFDISIGVEFKGDFVQIGTSMEQLAHSLSDTIDRIRTAASQVNVGATQISDGAQSLAAGTTEQASSIDELASTINTLDQQISENANNAAAASEKANDAGDKITESNRYMSDMISAMENISQKSSEISNIIATIDDIAFQTNILALNAAIEAARAGDAGKGFAVVADEVRNLAAKSAEAAQNTAILIKQSIDAVNDGSGIANNTAESLSSAVSVTREAVELINEISGASEQQAEMVKQVNLGIEQISAVVQTNAAAAEQSAASGEELNSQAAELEQLTDKFVLSRKNNRKH